MVLFVDLEDDEPPEFESRADFANLSYRWGRDGEGALVNSRMKGHEDNEKGGIMNKNSMTEAFGCYPVIASIASHIDLNTLDSLSLTCRQVRANLLQFRKQLLISTLHCENEDIDPDPEHTFRYRARAADYYFVETGADVGGRGKVGHCARDMVGGCRRCGRIVCRNCTIKPPAPVLLPDRHRRLCKYCSNAPLCSLISYSSPLESINPSSNPHSKSIPVSRETIQTSICTCSNLGVWLCQPCGRSLRSADTEYKSIWTWRTRYLPSLGGLGVGIGEGDRGVPCGRAADCLASREVEQETDCDAEDARSSRAESPAYGMVGGYVGGGASPQMGPGYNRHEIEGIGGVVKRKLVRMVKVGACVAEFGEEKDGGRFLVREVKGKVRSWCGWCWRVIPAKSDDI